MSSVVFEWLKIRDLFLGANSVSQNIPLALEMAVSCDHPDARWLSRVCDGKVKTMDQARTTFLGLGEDDALALSFSEMMIEFSSDWENDDVDTDRLQRSADLGDIFFVFVFFFFFVLSF
jgi:hypothetical protein